MQRRTPSDPSQSGPGKSSTVWLFFPATGILDTGSVKEARASLELSQGTGDIEIRVAMRTSNDGTTWSTAGWHERNRV